MRDTSIRALPFPFPAYRRGQRTLAVEAYRTIRDGGRLFCQAPTGIGKTISTLFPAVKAIGEGEAEKIFYLTAKTITRQVAQDACTLMREQGLRLKTVTLTAKDKICFAEERSCNPDACLYADGHFDRVNAALYELLVSGDEFTREVIEDCARRHRVCPYELSLDLTLWSDCIIADYNYVFDPQVYLRRFFSGQGAAGKHVFLIDEAHNLVDRAREMYSAGLRKADILEVHRALDKKDKLRKSLSRVNTAMVSMRKECEGERFVARREPCTEFTRILSVFSADCEEWLAIHSHAPQEEQVLNLYFSVLAFLRIAELYDERFVTLLYIHGTDVVLKLFCLDPSRCLDSCLKKGKAAVLFSATLTPLDYFSAVLGGNEESKRLMLPSPFPRDNLCLLITDNISTKYKNRDSSLLPLAHLIAQAAAGRPGNYMVYFPSYAYMNEVYRVFCENYPDFPTLLQHGGMDEEEREAFLAEFDAQREDTLIGFCVLGGIYAEGIDLKGDRLIGTVIVGVGLPQINPEQDVIRDYFNEVNGQGFAFAYQYPGMNKVLQAAGRVIRDESDRGLVLLVDERFTTPSYRHLLPAHWQGYGVVRSQDALKNQLAAFWE